MDTKDILNKEFFAQNFSEGQPYAKMLNIYKGIACNYARMENAIAVLSDWHTNESYIYYGGFSQMLGIEKDVKDSKVASIWEEETNKYQNVLEAYKDIKVMRWIENDKSNVKEEVTDTK